MRVRQIKARAWHPCAAARDGSWFRACESIAPGQQYFRVDVFPGESLDLYFLGEVEPHDHPKSVALCVQCGPGYTDTPTTPATRRSPSGRRGGRGMSVCEEVGTVVHIVEIRINKSDEWGLCDVFVHPVEKSLAITVCDLANKVKAHVFSHGDASKTTTTRTLGGDLRAAVIHIDHDGGSSFFRHTIRGTTKPGPWLDRKTKPAAAIRDEQTAHTPAIDAAREDEDA